MLMRSLESCCQDLIILCSVFQLGQNLCLCFHTHFTNITHWGGSLYLLNSLRKDVKIRNVGENSDTIKSHIISASSLFFQVQPTLKIKQPVSRIPPSHITNIFNLCTTILKNALKIVKINDVTSLLLKKKSKSNILKVSYFSFILLASRKEC